MSLKGKKITVDKMVWKCDKIITSDKKKSIQHETVPGRKRRGRQKKKTSGNKHVFNNMGYASPVFRVATWCSCREDDIKLIIQYLGSGCLARLSLSLGIWDAPEVECWGDQAVFLWRSRISFDSYVPHSSIKWSSVKSGLVGAQINPQAFLSPRCRVLLTTEIDDRWLSESHQWYFCNHLPSLSSVLKRLMVMMKLWKSIQLIMFFLSFFLSFFCLLELFERILVSWCSCFLNLPIRLMSSSRMYRQAKESSYALKLPLFMTVAKWR